MVNAINSLNLKTNIEIKGTAGEDGKNKVISVDFSDRRFANRLLKLIHRYGNIENELNEKISNCDEIEDPVEKMLKLSDFEVEVLEEFKDNVNGVFGFDIVKELFGDCLPCIERYFEFFDALTPYVVAANKIESERVSAIRNKYGLERINKAGE